MPWELNNDRPIYLQLMEQIKLRIITGENGPGDKLPAVRELAMEAAVNPNTMQKALAELEREGLVAAQRTSGRLITDDIERIRKMKREMASGELETFFRRMSRLGFTKDDIIDMIEKQGKE